MPEEAQNPAPEEDTPAQEMEETPTEDTSAAPVVDYQKRYEDIRPEFDRTRQALAERDELIRQYEEQFAGDQPAYEDPEYDDEEYVDVEARQKLVQLEALLAQKSQQETLTEQREQEYAHIDSEFDALEAEHGVELSDKVATRIGRDAQQLRDEFDRPDVRRAYAEWQADLEAEKVQWVDKKRSAAKPASGPGAVEVPDKGDRKARIAYINELARQQDS